jgi:putative transposase
MPWKGVTVDEQRQRFIEDHELKYYSISELSERFGISRTTAHKWINRYQGHGQAGFHEQSRWSKPRAWRECLLSLVFRHRAFSL